MNRKISESLYSEICSTLTDFENAPEYDTEEGWLSDGEWLDVFYDLCVKVQREAGE